MEHARFAATLCQTVAVALTMILFVNGTPAWAFSEAQSGSADGKTPNEATVVDAASEPSEIETIILPGDVPLELVLVPAGTYMRGRYPEEQDSDDREAPQHEVTLSEDFWMSRYPITQAQWLAIMRSWPGRSPNSYSGLGPDYPAYYVSLRDAQLFVQTLNRHITETGQGEATARIPTEAEWEYACRAGTTTRFYWGDDPDYTDIDDYAWFSGNNEPFGVKPVGEKLPNAFGLYDMSGNVFEWCHDIYGEYPGGPTTDPRGHTQGAYRVIRGGSWYYYPAACRSAYRSGHQREERFIDVGFRVVR